MTRTPSLPRDASEAELERTWLWAFEQRSKLKQRLTLALACYDRLTENSVLPPGVLAGRGALASARNRLIEAERQLPMILSRASITAGMKRPEFLPILKQWGLSFDEYIRLVEAVILKLMLHRVPEKAEEIPLAERLRFRFGGRARRRIRATAYLEAVLGHDTAAALPIRLILDPSTTCNFHCAMCMAHSPAVKTFPVNFSFLNSIRSIFPNLENIHLAGTGEPLMCPGLADILEICRAYKIPGVDTITNGSLVQKHLKVFRSITRTTISFDGDNARTFELIRSGGSFEAVLGNIRLLRKTYPRMNIQLGVVVSRLNVDEIAGIAGLVRELSVNGLHLGAIITLDFDDFLALCPSDYPLFADQVAQARALAAAAGFELMNNVSQLHFNAPVDTPRDKEAIRSRLETILKAPRVRQPEVDLERGLAALGSLAGVPRLGAPPAPNTLSVGAEPVAFPAWPPLEELYQAVRALPGEEVPLPHCLAPWVMSYINADGSLRACCMLQLDEEIVTQDFRRAWNGPVYRALRRAMLYQEPLPEMCVNCQDSFRYERYRELMDIIGRHTGRSRFRFPKNFDQGRLQV